MVAVALVALVALVAAAAQASLFDKIRAPPKRQAQALTQVSVAGSLNDTAVVVPSLIYATEYKRHQTAELVERALRAGFRGVDTAAGEGHRFNESGVGEALAATSEALKNQS